MRKRHRILMDAAGADGGAGGTGTTALTNGGGAANPSGGTSGGTPPAAGAPPAGAPGAGENPSGDGTANWMSQLSEGLRENSTMKKYKSVEELANAYINAQKFISGDKIVVPGQTATEEDWKNVFKKLGVPDEVDKYDVKFKEGATLDKAFTEQFKALAHKSGILPKQAQALADWFSDANASAEKNVQAAHEAQVAEKMGALKKEWGEAYQQKFTGAAKIVREFGDKELIAALDSTGAGNEPAVIKLLAKVADMLWKDDKIVDNPPGQGSGLTPSEAKAELERMYSDMNGPAFNRESPGHKAAVQRMMELRQAMIVKG